MITFECPQCGTKYEAEEDWIGTKVQCETCSARFYVPGPGEPIRMAPPKHSAEHIVEKQTVSSSSSDNKIVISFDDIPSTTGSATVPESRKLSPRQRRLVADSQMMYQRFSTFPYIHLVEATISQNLFDIINGTDVQSDYHECVMTIARNLVQNRNQAKDSH